MGVLELFVVLAVGAAFVMFATSDRSDHSQKGRNNHQLVIATCLLRFIVANPCLHLPCYTGEKSKWIS